MTWIVKLPGTGRYYKFVEGAYDKVYYTYQQSKSHKFSNKEDAKRIVDHIYSSTFVTAKIVKLKVRQESKSYCSSCELISPKQGTVFLDLTMPSPEPNIVTCVYLDRYENGGDDIEYVCTTNAVSPKEDTWGSLEEYNDYLNSGSIKVIWEPSA